MDRPADDLAAATVRYLPEDGADDAAEWRVDLIDPRTATAVASMTPDEACAVAVRLLEESLKARVRHRA